MKIEGVTFSRRPLTPQEKRERLLDAAAQRAHVTAILEGKKERIPMDVYERAMDQLDIYMIEKEKKTDWRPWGKRSLTGKGV